jgi:hypothetical protein
MAKDHFIPRAYLRGFTHEYLTGQKGRKLVVYNPSSGNSGSLSINEHVACEPEFITATRSIRNGLRRSSERGEMFTTD